MTRPHRATTPTPSMSSGEDLAWLVQDFVATVPGVEHAIVVSSDGVLVTASEGFPAEHTDQLAAIVSGLNSLAGSTAQMFAKGQPDQLILRMQHGYLFAMPIGDGSSLAALASHEADTKIAAYQMTLLVEGVGHALTPHLRDTPAAPTSDDR